MNWVRKIGIVVLAVVAAAGITASFSKTAKEDFNEDLQEQYKHGV